MECFVTVTVLWVFSVCLHEFGHAWAAYRGGDYTVRDKGYLTLNPVHYAHPVYSLLLPIVFMMLGGIGLPGGAVYIEHHLLRSRRWETWVSLAGPLMNVAMVLVIGLAFRAGLIPNDSHNLVSISFAFLLQLEVSAIVLNLLPLPPLDGYQAISPWLPDDIRRSFESLSSFSLFLLFMLLWNVPAFNGLFWGVVDRLIDLIGVNPDLAEYGHRAFRFWEYL